MLLALHAGVETQKVNAVMGLYTLSRIAYFLAYVLVEKEQWSFLRTVWWYVGNISCGLLMGVAGANLQ